MRDARAVLKALFQPADRGVIRLQGDRTRPYGQSPEGQYQVKDYDHHRLLEEIGRQRLERDIRVSVAVWRRVAHLGEMQPVRLRAVWVRSISAHPGDAVVSELQPTWVIGSEAGRETAWGWQLEKPATPEAANTMAEALAGRLGREFEAVRADDYIRLPDTIDHTAPPSMVVLKGGSAASVAPDELAAPDGAAAGAGPTTDSDEVGGDGDPAAPPSDVHARSHVVDDLASEPDILGAFRRELLASGFAGDTVVPEAVFLVGTSRLLARPVSLLIRAPSSSGKSFVVDTALQFLPEPAYRAVTAMSEKAIMWIDSLEHQLLVIAEGSGLVNDTIAYGIRSLLSEGVLRYEYTDFEQRKTVQREVAGPTGLIVTTTRPLDPELETRVLTLTVPDSPEQTAVVVSALAELAAGRTAARSVDRERFQLLQERLAELRLDVVVPFAPALGQLVDTRAVRMRRDFSTVLGLIKAHALLHQATRPRNAAGAVEATMADYSAAHRIASSAVAEAVERSLSPKLRETVEAVTQLAGPNRSPVTATQLARHLGLEISSTRRRIIDAVAHGYLFDQGGGRGRPHKLVPGDPLPADRGALPAPAELEEACTRACTPEVKT